MTITEIRKANKRHVMIIHNTRNHIPHELHYVAAARLMVNAWVATLTQSLTCLSRCYALARLSGFIYVQMYFSTTVSIYSSNFQYKYVIFNINM